MPEARHADRWRQDLLDLPSAIMLDDLIAIVSQKQDRSVSYDVYVAHGEDDLTPGMQVWVDRPVFVDEDDVEVFPREVVLRRFGFAYAAHQLQDVVDVAIGQRPTVSIVDIVAALNHYADHDNFMEL